MKHFIGYLLIRKKDGGRRGRSNLKGQRKGADIRMKANVSQLFKEDKNGNIRRTWRYWLARLSGSVHGIDDSQLTDKEDILRDNEAQLKEDTDNYLSPEYH